MDSLVDLKGLPANVDAERLVLGSIMLDSALYIQASAALKMDDFSLEKHRRIFRRMGDIYTQGKAIDRVTLANELMRQDELESVDGLGYLVSLDDGLPKIVNLDSYIRIIKDKSILRSVIFAAENLSQRCILEQDEPGAIIERASRMLLDLTPETADDLQNPYEVIEAHRAGELSGLNALLATPQRGIPSGIRQLDDFIIGFQPGDLYLLAARPSAGKTALALQIAHRAAKDDAGTIFFSLEMGKLPLAVRLACSLASVDSQLVRAGMLNQDERMRLARAVGEMRELPLWFDKQCRTVPAMHAKVRRARMSRNVRLIVLDYLQLMESAGRHENRNQEVTAISRGLKLMGEEFEVPILALSQLSRPERGVNKEPELTDLRDSGALEQDADVAMFLWAHEGNKTGTRRLLLKKQRNGPLGFFDLAFVLKYQQFRPLVVEG